jgi:hypothetical protein
MEQKISYFYPFFRLGQITQNLILSRDKLLRAHRLDEDIFLEESQVYYVKIYTIVVMLAKFIHESLVIS